jgi:hypothetical protein
VSGDASAVIEPGTRTGKRDSSSAARELVERLKASLGADAGIRCPRGHELSVPREMLSSGREVFCPRCRRAFRPGGGVGEAPPPAVSTAAAIAAAAIEAPAAVSPREGLGQIAAGLDILARAAGARADEGLELLARLMRVDSMPAWLFTPVRVPTEAVREVVRRLVGRLVRWPGWAISCLLHAAVLLAVAALGLHLRLPPAEPRAPLTIPVRAAPRAVPLARASGRDFFTKIAGPDEAAGQPEIRLPEARPGEDSLTEDIPESEIDDATAPVGLDPVGAIGPIPESLALPGNTRPARGPRRPAPGEASRTPPVQTPLAKGPGAERPLDAPVPPALPAGRGGLRVFNCGTMTRVTPDWKPSLAGARLRPVEIVAARNGAFCGQVLLRTDRVIAGLRVAAGELKLRGAEGAIPASAVEIRYPRMETMRFGSIGFSATSAKLCDALLAKPAPRNTQGPIQPVWIKVRVPAGAKPGEYRGQLSVTAGGRLYATVPLHVKVSAWKLPDPQDYVTHVGMIQSPESVALQYEVALWSERHWKLVEKSVKLAGEAGCKTIYLPLICRTNLGNSQGVVRWIPGGNGHTYDFTAFDRYLDICQKHMKPDVVCLYVWDLYSRDDPPRARHRWNVVGRNCGPKVSGRGAAVIQGPKFGTAGSVRFWRPAMTEVKRRLEKRGLWKHAMLGMTPDVGRWGNFESARKTFASVDSDLKWINNSHMDFPRYRDRANSPFKYFTMVYAKLLPTERVWDRFRKCGWNMRVKCDRFYRDYSTPSRMSLAQQPLAEQRSIAEWALLSHQSGPGRIGLDFWPVLGRRPGRPRAGWTHTSDSISARYPESSWNQLNLQRCCEALLAPGPNGAIPTVRYEMVREGIQECEARIFVEKALVDPALRPRLDADLAKSCEKLLDERAKRIWCGTRQVDRYLGGDPRAWRRAALERGRKLNEAHRALARGRTNRSKYMKALWKDRDANWQKVIVREHDKQLEELFTAAARVAEKLPGRPAEKLPAKPAGKGPEKPDERRR